MKKPLVTEIESVEVKRVVEARSRAKTTVFILALLAFIAISVLLATKKIDNEHSTWIYIALFITYFVFNYLVHHKYDGYLKLAERNDQIRHEERVRAMERERLNQMKEIERLQQEIERLKQNQK